MDAALSWLVGGRSQKASHALLFPAAAWLALFLLIPVACLLAMSLAQRGAYGTVIWSFTWSNFARAMDPKYMRVLIRTLGFASATTGVCLLAGFPLAYYISFYAGSRRDLLLAALMIPFWTSCLVSLYSWMIILGREGLLNSLLLHFGVIATPLQILNTRFSVLLGMVYFYIPFMVLPLYGSLEKIPRQYLEASADLGAGSVKTFLKITLPLSLPGVFAGCILTFIPCMGDFLTADFLGGPNTHLLGNLIQNQFLMAQDWPFGAALTSLLLLMLVTGLFLYQRVEQDA
jgi:spermidine/putrescine transport system permease protein